MLNEDLDNSSESNEKSRTQLEAVVEYISDVFAASGCEKVPKPWLPSLPYQLTTSQLAITTGERLDLSIPLGVVDIPNEQSQEEYVLDLEKEGNFGYFAAGGYGKSMMLATCMLALARKNAVSMLNFYLFDLGNSAMIPFKDLAHTAAYITYDDVERRNKFLKMIQAEIKTRKRLLARASAQNFSVYNQICEEPLKAIVIVVDNMDILKEIGSDEEEEFSKIARDGAGLGIYLMFSAISENGIRYATMNNIKVKVCGYMYDPMDISSLVGRGEYKLPDKKGRAMVNYRGVNIMQVYTAVPFEDEIRYMEEIKQAIANINATYEGQHAPRIPILPELFRYEQMAEYERSKQEPDIVLGLDVEEVRLEGMRASQSPFVIIGESGRGKTNALRIILNQLAGQTVYLFDSKSRELNTYKSMEGVTYVQSQGELEAFITELTDIGNTRSEEFAAAIASTEGLTMKEFIASQPPIYVVVDGTDEFIEWVNEDYEEEIKDVLEKAAGLGVCMIFSVHAVKFHGYDDLTSWIKSANYGLVLGEQGTSEIFPVSYRDTVEFTKGLLFNNGASIKIMLPEC